MPRQVPRIGKKHYVPPEIQPLLNEFKEVVGEIVTL